MYDKINRDTLILTDKVRDLDIRIKKTPWFRVIEHLKLYKELRSLKKQTDDIGKELKVGAHMASLVRTKAGPFSDKEMFSLHDLKDAYEFWKEGDNREIKKIIKPFEKAVEHLPKIWILDSAVNPLCHGYNLFVPGISKLNDNINKDDIVAVFTLKNELICLGKAEMTNDGMLKEEKGTAVKTDKVFMERDIYKAK